MPGTPAIPLDRITDLLTDAGEPHTGHAGGTTVLWARVPDNRVILVGSPSGPWRPDHEGMVTADAFVLQLFPTVETYLDGADPISELECPFTLDALAATIGQLLRPDPVEAGPHLPASRARHGHGDACARSRRPRPAPTPLPGPRTEP